MKFEIRDVYHSGNVEVYYPEQKETVVYGRRALQWCDLASGEPAPDQESLDKAVRHYRRKRFLRIAVLVLLALAVLIAAPLLL